MKCLSFKSPHIGLGTWQYGHKKVVAQEIAKITAAAAVSNQNKMEEKKRVDIYSNSVSCSRGCILLHYNIILVTDQSGMNE